MQKSKYKSGKQEISRRGLSIIELLVVMSILTILASIGVTTYSGVTSRNRAKTAKHVMASFRTAMDTYKTQAHKGVCATPNCSLGGGCLLVPSSHCASAGENGKACFVDGFYPSEVCVTSYTDLYNALSPYMSGDYGRYFNTATFSYKSSAIDVVNLNIPTAYTISSSANISDPSLITATHKTLEATLNGALIK